MVAAQQEDSALQEFLRGEHSQSSSCGTRGRLRAADRRVDWLFAPARPGDTPPIRVPSATQPGAPGCARHSAARLSSVRVARYGWGRETLDPGLPRVSAEQGHQPH